MRAARGTKTRPSLGFLAEAQGELVGAVAGYTWGGICEVRQVWVHEAYRGEGLGEALITEASREAKARGCAYIYLATHDFQAPGFYAKLGFQKVAEIPDKPLGHTEIVMRLPLRSASS
jgi:ribosomal protein S18 acetylase RimI-like enzyme